VLYKKFCVAVRAVLLVLICLCCVIDFRFFLNHLVALRAVQMSLTISIMMIKNIYLNSLSLFLYSLGYGHSILIK